MKKNKYYEYKIDSNKTIFVLSFPFYNDLSKKLEKIFNDIIFKYVKGENTFVSKKYGADTITYTVICNEEEVFMLRKMSEKLSLLE